MGEWKDAAPAVSGNEFLRKAVVCYADRNNIFGSKPRSIGTDRLLSYKKNPPLYLEPEKQKINSGPIWAGSL